MEQLWTKAVDRAMTPGLLARQVILALGQAEEARLSYSFTTGLPRGVERSCFTWGLVQETEIVAMGLGRGHLGLLLFSVVKYNLLKSGFSRNTPLWSHGPKLDSWGDRNQMPVP